MLWSKLVSSGPFGLVLAFVALGCAPPSRGPNVPVSTTGADLPEITSATRSFPPDAPAGDVRLAAIGLTSRTDGRTAVHVRMAVNNRGAEPWTIFPGEQRVELSTKEQSFAADVAGDIPEAVEVASGETQTLELYFPLPPRLQDTRAMDPFSVAWTIRVGGLPFTQVTYLEGFPIAERDR